MMTARRQKLSEEVRRQLLDLIRSGTVGLGEQLPSERELMESLGVGRPAIREAMQSLETIGLIEIRHGGRARVAEPSVGRMVDQMSETMKHLLVHSPASLENYKEARATFEREMARTAARRRSEADLERLVEIISEQTEAAADPPRFRTRDGTFIARSRRSTAIRSSPLSSMPCSAGSTTFTSTWYRRPASTAHPCRARGNSCSDHPRPLRRRGDGDGRPSDASERSLSPVPSDPQRIVTLKIVARRRQLV